MKAIVPKLIIGGLGAGTVGAGAIYASLPDKYSDYLNKQGRVLLASNSEKWAEIKTIYDSQADDLIITIDGEKLTKENSTSKKIKDWCSKNSNNTFTDTKDKTYQKVSALCTEPKTIQELIGSNKTVLNDDEPTVGKEDSDKQEWQKKQEAYAQLKEDDKSKLIKEINGDAEGTVIEAKDFNDATKLRKWCKYSKTKHFKHEEDQRFLNYLNWCVK